MEGSQTYFLELGLSLRHLDNRFAGSFVRGSFKKKAIEIVFDATSAVVTC